MVKECENCGEFAYATRYKDSYLSFCRACGYWREPRYVDDKLVPIEGTFTEEKLERMSERWPLSGKGVDERFK